MSNNWDLFPLRSGPLDFLGLILAWEDLFCGIKQFGFI